MGYFSNGTENEIYMSNVCANCIHGQDWANAGCAVMDAHMHFNYDECNNDASILNTLIPRSEKGIGNQQCAMFIERRPEPLFTDFDKKFGELNERLRPYQSDIKTDNANGNPYATGLIAMYRIFVTEQCDDSLRLVGEAFDEWLSFKNENAS